MVFAEQRGARGGFDVVLGNPPWERVKLQEQEFFAARDPDIAAAPNAATRRRMIAQLPETNPGLHGAYVDALREADGVSRLIRQSGRFPLCGRGDVNTYAVFAELMRESDRHRRAGSGASCRRGLRPTIRRSTSSAR